MAAATNCTVELIHGGTIHVPLSVAEVRNAIAQTRKAEHMAYNTVDNEGRSGSAHSGLCRQCRARLSQACRRALRVSVWTSIQTSVVAILPLDSCTSKGGRS